MLTRLILFAAVVIAIVMANPSLLHAQGVITVRLSYKVVLNPADGNRPTKSDGTQVTDSDLDTAVASMNSLSAAYFRGFRFQRVGSVTNVGGKNDMTGPSKYFGFDFQGSSNGTTIRDQMEAAALSDARYAWSTNAINIYINQGTTGGLCSFPDSGKSIIIVGAVSANAGNTQLHEVGHYFNLSHTQSDDLSDTLLDNPSWTEDTIAQNSFSGKNYNQLNAGEKQQVDDTVLNLMSYHGTTGNQAPIYNLGQTQSRLTEQQLNRWTDAANGARVGVCDGTTVFARVSNQYGSGSSGAPYGSLVVATAVASNRPGNNIVMLLPGVSSEAITINPPRGTTVILRATRQGPIIIGSR